MSDMRALIREILMEELAGLKKGSTFRTPQLEAVAINSNEDLKAFALKVLELSKNRDLKSDIQSGNFQFVLNGGVRGETWTAPMTNISRCEGSRFEKGLITEKDIARLDAGTRSIATGKNVCFTPLARDEIRRRGIKIERNSQ
ncbi:MAG: hypothetical protein DHS20C01_22490 [marine bacterium B5-7]|nr:MAG: hypothetical protein DHS20C01_22490 [marine bacterium B5-7]